MSADTSRNMNNTTVNTNIMNRLTGKATNSSSSPMTEIRLYKEYILSEIFYFILIIYTDILNQLCNTANTTTNNTNNNTSTNTSGGVKSRTNDTVANSSSVLSQSNEEFEFFKVNILLLLVLLFNIILLLLLVFEYNILLLVVVLLCI